MCNDKLYTTKEAAERLGWNRKKLATEARLHKIAPLKINGGNCYTPAMLEELKTDKSIMTGIETLRTEPGFSRRLLARFAEERELEFLVLNNSKYYMRQELDDILASEEYKKEYLLIEEKLKKQAVNRQKCKEGPTLPKQTTEKGFTAEDLADMFNYSIAHIQKILRDNNIKPICYKKGTRNKRLYPEDVIKIFKGVGIIVVDANTLFSTAEVLDILGWSRAELKKQMTLRAVKPIKQRGAFNYFNEEMIKQLQSDEFERVPITAICREYKVNNILLKDFAKKENIETTTYNRTIYYKKEDLINIVMSEDFQRESHNVKKDCYLQNKTPKSARKLFYDAVNNNKSIDELIDVALLDFNENTPITKQLYKDYMMQSTVRGKGDVVAAIRRKSIYGKKFSDLLMKEVTEYTDAEVKELLSIAYEKMKRKVHIIESFFGYLLNRVDVKTKFVATYSIKEQTIPMKKEKVYTEEEWFALIDYVCDIPLHEELAINSELYAQAWVFVMMHTFLGWRKMDMGKLPYPDYEIVNMPLEKEQFDQADAEVLIKSIELKCSNLISNKTGSPLHFVYPPMHMRLAFGVAVSVLDWHRRAENSEHMLSLEFVKNYSVKIENVRFFDRFVLEDFRFSSKMANSTLLGTLYGTAIKNKGYVAMAYRLSSFMRSHKSDLEGLNNTTAIYITAGAADKDLDDVSLALFQRGTFGFAYKDLLTILSKGNDHALDFEQTTLAISSLREVFSPRDIELINGYLLHSMNLKRNVISELLEMAPVQRKNLLEDLEKNNRVGKEQYVQCMKPGKCHNATSLKCMGCEYAIMTYEIGYKITREIYEHCDKIKRANEEKKELMALKEKSELIKLIHLAKEFHNTLAYMGENFLNIVLPMNEIKKQVSVLQSETTRIGD